MAKRAAHLPERIAVIGLGRFGTSVATTLHEIGYEVTAIDLDEAAVAHVADTVLLAAQGDATEPELLRSLRIDESDIAVVALGENLGANLTITLLLKQLGVPHVVAKATTTIHADLLRKIGADRIVFPEIDEGARVAHSIVLRDVFDYIPLTHTSGIARIVVPEHLVGKTVADFDTACSRTLHLLVIQQRDELIVFPNKAERIGAGDLLVIAGNDRDVSRIIRPNGTSPSPRA